MKFLMSSRRLVRPALLSLMLAVCTPAMAQQTTAKSASAKPKTKIKPKISKVSHPIEAPGEFANFGQWREVAEFIEQMVSRHGFDKAELDSLFRKVNHVERTIQLIKPAPPGKPKNYRAYRDRFVDPVRIQAGVNFWNDHASALARAEETYGVPAEIIVGIIGVETVYGRNTGSFRVLDAVTTLAFDYPQTPNRAARMTFFKGELENTLLYARENRIDPLTLLGSYAGAIGWPQFMPSSIRNFAIDFDGDGRIDLRNSPVDAIGSVANFLVQHGWRRGEPIVFPATVTTTVIDGKPDNRWEAFIGQGLEAKFKLEELTATGIATSADTPTDLSYGLVDLQNGLDATEYWLGAANFFAITKYNRSFFYAMSVVDLSQAVKAARGR